MGVAAAATSTSAPPLLAAIEWEESLVGPAPVSPAVAREVRSYFGLVPGWVPYSGRVPWVARSICRAVGNPITAISPELVNLIAFVVSQDNSCRHCYGATRTLLRVAGFREEAIARIERDFHLADLSPADRAALELARRVSRGHPRPGAAEFSEAARAGLNRAAQIEVVVNAALGCGTNRISSLVAVPPERQLEAIPRMPLFRIVRPVIAWRIRSVKKPPPPPTRADGPCAGLVAALGSAPAAGAVQRTFEEAMASEVLPRRTKALMLAVVARALGCTLGEAEARTLLAAEGFSASDVDQVLAHLASPRLDAREARLVPFARETVRYQPAAIQRRMREVTAGMTPEEIIETAGMLSLANGLCRLSVVVDAC